MQQRFRTTVLAIVMPSLLLVSACQTTSLIAGPPSLATEGRLIAALDGGLIGQISALSLAPADTRQALSSEYRALEYAAPGELVTWQSGQQALAGQVTASQPYRVGSQDCRQFSHRVFNTTPGADGSQPATARGTACRNEDGSWTLLT
ncbi:MAG: hypothetical protein AAF940_01710 [Pseudomonadota bacterium]